MATKFFVCSICKKVEIVKRTFFKIFQIALIIEMFKIKKYPAIRHFVLQLDVIKDVTPWVDVQKLQI